MRNGEWPCHVCFIGIVSSVILSLSWKCKLSSQLFTCTSSARIASNPRSPSSGVDLNQDFSRLRLRYGTCYRLKVQLVCKLNCFHLWHLLYSLNSLCLLRVAFTLSKLVLFVIESPAQFRDRFRSLSNVNLSGSQNASKNAAAAAEKTE